MPSAHERSKLSKIYTKRISYDPMVIRIRLVAKLDRALYIVRAWGERFSPPTGMKFYATTSQKGHMNFIINSLGAIRSL